MRAIFFILPVDEMENKDINASSYYCHLHYKGTFFWQRGLYDYGKDLYDFAHFQMESIGFLCLSPAFLK